MAERAIIWVTGCAGFLGTRLARDLTGANYQVVGLSRRLSTAVHEAVVIDLSSSDAPLRIHELASAKGRPDVVVHAASKQPGEGEFHSFVKSNLVATSNLLEGLQGAPPSQIIYTSTISVYATGVAMPIVESAPPSGNGLYAATKRWAEQLLENWKHSQVVILRLPSLYGAGQADSFIDGFARLALSGEPIELFGRGETIRDALHVSDVVRALRTCINRPPDEPFSIMNLGMGQPITAAEYTQALVASLGSKSKIVLSDRPVRNTSSYADISKAKRLIGFQPTSLEESMKLYANELRA
jgi:nucleoside-diphosphate-sugar epimerase